MDIRTPKPNTRKQRKAQAKALQAKWQAAKYNDSAYRAYKNKPVK